MQEDDNHELTDAAPTSNEIASETRTVRRRRAEPLVPKRGAHAFQLTEKAKQVFEGPDPAAWVNRFASPDGAGSPNEENCDGENVHSGAEETLDDVATDDAPFDNFMNGAALVEQVKKGLFFQLPMDHHARFGLQASMIEDAEGKVSIDPVQGWHARWQVLGQMTDRLIAESLTCSACSNALLTRS